MATAPSHAVADRRYRVYAYDAGMHHWASYGHFRASVERPGSVTPHAGDKQECVRCGGTPKPRADDLALWIELNWDPGLLGPIGRAYREGPWPRFRDRVEGVGWRYCERFAHAKDWRCPPWTPLPEDRPDGWRG